MHFRKRQTILCQQDGIELCFVCPAQYSREIKYALEYENQNIVW